MQVVSGHGKDTQWFDYKPGFFVPAVRVEWDKDTMFATLPPEIAAFLISRNYARAITDEELETYTSPAGTAESETKVEQKEEPAPPPPPKSRSKKG